MIIPIKIWRRSFPKSPKIIDHSGGRISSFSISIRDCDVREGGLICCKLSVCGLLQTLADPFGSAIILPLARQAIRSTRTVNIVLIPSQPQQRRNSKKPLSRYQIRSCTCTHTASEICREALYARDYIHLKPFCHIEAWASRGGLGGRYGRGLGGSL